MKAITGCQPLFDAMGKKTFGIDEKPPTANLIKLGGNVLIMCIIDSLGETFALTRKSGWLIANEQYEPAGFKMALGLKDTRLALAAADSLLVPMPLASQIHDRMLTVVARGAGDIDWSALARLSASNAGLHC
jgi:3-hydroxyisobutyrate dehydrogenase-like beta-hydroxyacid dehydrogenase